MVVETNTVLLILLNIVGFLSWVQIADIKHFMRETRKKLDGHTEDQALHCNQYKARVLHAKSN